MEKQMCLFHMTFVVIFKILIKSCYVWCALSIQSQGEFGKNKQKISTQLNVGSCLLEARKNSGNVSDISPSNTPPTLLDQIEVLHK